ncbi:NADP-dependent oxidoreductase [Gordonia sp. w5E2]|uniref:NADPH:quinone reductase n=1 Tax=Gordonia jacobaea TaxID=122202 RepID=A0ABR5IBY3_9ACTN|nr:NADP-dependent oxidoreductase [Gordonia jacobaea]KNA91123.1 NADPH:quinone reductase [Gordonia jacobaea]SKY00594.1 Synaptic vesicle membrane protein VAT-1-like protein [Mycobacteroides abscessus subsp. abscessus]
MRAISQDRLGGPEVLTEVDIDTPTPGLGQILVRVHAAGVNPVDAMNRETGMFVGNPPFVLGWDVSGTVEKVGLGSTLFAPGDEVVGLLPFPQGHGAYAEYVVAPTRVFVPKPAALDHVHAAALPLAGLTAWQALVETAHVGQGSRVLITGAAGGVGHLAVQIAKARGAYVYAVAGAASADFLTGLGVDEVIDYTTTDFVDAVTDLDVVFDVIGHDYPSKAVQALKPGGILVSTLPQSLPDVAESATGKGIRLAGLFVEADRLGMTELAKLVSDGRLQPVVAATFPLADAGQAQSSKAGPGKTVLTVVEDDS